ARGRWESVDARTDVWSVGAILFTIISGRTVYEGETSNDVLIACATQAPPSLASVVKDVPAGVVDVVDRALSVNPDARWQDASRMQAAIRRLLETSEDLEGGIPVARRAVETPLTLSETDVPSIVNRFDDVPHGIRSLRPTMRRAALPILVAA